MDRFPAAVLFDLDDTLFDHRHASHAALQAIHAQHAQQADFTAFAQQHAHVLETYHRRFLHGELTLDEARAARMIELFEAFGYALTPEQSLQIGALYRQHHLANRQLVKGAYELLEALHGRTKLAIITNNSVAEQLEKLRHLGIAHFFEAIIISEDVGFTKPDRRIFELALERLGVAASQSVMIGDNRAADIEGAHAAGIATVWLNRNFETQALTRFAGHNAVEKPTVIGDCPSMEIAALHPVDNVLDAIQHSFIKKYFLDERLHLCTTGNTGDLKSMAIV